LFFIEGCSSYKAWLSETREDTCMSVQDFGVDNTVVG